MNRKPQHEDPNALVPSSRMDGTRGFFLSLSFYAATSVLGVAGFLLVPRVHEWAARGPFDSTLWKQAGDSSRGPELRMNMVHSLLRQQELAGKSRAQLEDLLGPDDETHVDLWSMYYRLADRPGVFPDGGRGLTVFLDDEDVAYAIELRD